MKKTEYTELTHSEEDKLQELYAEKVDDYNLPEFSKEVPVSSKTEEAGDDVSFEYEWKKSDTPIIRIKRINFRKNEGLDEVYRIAARDGADSICFRHNNTTYILRKTAREIAQALYNAYGKIKGALENIVGYIRTVLGNDYVISKVERECWSFDRRISKAGINYLDVDTLDKKCKDRLCEMITEAISDLHASNIILGRFTLNNVLFTENDMKFSDLRRMRVSRKRSLVIDEFKSVLQYLFAIGVASREEIYGSVAYYMAKNEDSCNEWYKERTGSKAKDPFDIAAKMEEDVFN